MELRLYLNSSHSVWWYSEFPCTQRSFPGGTQTIPIFITVYLVAQTIPILITESLVVLRLSLYSSKSPWWYSDYLYTHHSLPCSTQTIYILIKVSLVVLRLSLYSPQSLWRYSDYPYTYHSLPWWYSDDPYTHHSLLGGHPTIPIHITVSLVVLRLSLYTSLSLWWYSDYPYTHHSLSGFTGISDGPLTYHSLPGCTQIIPILITVSLVVLRLSLWTSQSP